MPLGNTCIWTMNKGSAFEQGVTDGKQRERTGRKINMRMVHACIMTNLNKTDILKENHMHSVIELSFPFGSSCLDNGKYGCGVNGEVSGGGSET